MDPILTPAILTTALTKLVGTAAGEAGTMAWDALKGLITRHRGTAPEQPTTPEAVAKLAEQLAADAAANPAFAQELNAWQMSVNGSDNVVNTVTGNVGKLVQGRDFSAPITFN